MPPRERQRAERSDAKANRERILVAAESYFAERGVDASLHELVKRVGVGIGTLYRHFPTHADLIRALYDRTVDRIDEVAVRAAACDTGWGALEVFIDGTVDALITQPATGDIMRRQAENDPAYRPGTKWEEPLQTYIDRAKAEGILRTDVAGTDVAVIPYLLSSVRHYPEPVRSIVLARQRALILDGMRTLPREATTLPVTAPTVDDHHAVAHGAAPPARRAL